MGTVFVILGEKMRKRKKKMAKFCEDKFLGYTMVVSYELDAEVAFANKSLAFTMHVEVRDEKNEMVKEFDKKFDYTNDINQDIFNN